MENSIVKLEDGIEYSLYRRYIFGLNLLPDSSPHLLDPRIEFLRGVCSQTEVCASVGSWEDFASEPGELFENTKYAGQFASTEIGYCHRFFDSANFADGQAPIFFRRIEADFLDLIRSGDSLAFDFLYRDTLALFISPKSDTATDDLIEILSKPLPAIEVFFGQVSPLFELLLITAADGDYFTCYSSNSESFSILDGPLAKAVQTVKDNAWYKAVKPKLEWDDEYSMCLLET